MGRTAVLTDLFPERCSRVAKKQKFTDTKVFSPSHVKLSRMFYLERRAFIGRLNEIALMDDAGTRESEFEALFANLDGSLNEFVIQLREVLRGYSING